MVKVSTGFATVGEGGPGDGNGKESVMGTTVATLDDIFTTDISDEALENAGGISATAQAGSSLYSTVQACGCTC
jgi:hypothetical protein